MENVFERKTVRKAVFLDRDGTLNVEKDYLHRIEDFEFIPGAQEAIKKLKDAGFLVIVITNQSGVGRGYYTLQDVDRLHEHIQKKLSEADTAIDAGLPAAPDVPGQRAYRAVPGKAIRPVTAHLQVGDIEAQQAIPAGAKEITFRVPLPAGKQRLKATWKTADGEVYGAYYAYVEKL